LYWSIVTHVLSPPGCRGTEGVASQRLSTEGQVSSCTITCTLHNTNSNTLYKALNIEMSVWAMHVFR